MKNLFKKSLLVLMVAFIAVFTLSVTSKVKAAETEIEFALGANGSASHADGSGKSSYTETVNGYTLNITNATNFYTGARDAKGNSCLKLGASSKACSFTITVPNDVTSVVFYAAKYKANTTKLSVNNMTHTLTKNSNDGAYDEITVDTSSNKTISVKTVSGGYRCMINTIKFIIADASSEPVPSISLSGETFAKVGGTDVTLTATTNTTGEIQWTSSNSEIATVDANGVVTPVKMGTVTITAKLADDETVFTSHSIKVYPKNENEITLEQAIAIAEFAGSDDSPYDYTVSGTVTGLYNTTYGNFYITDGTNQICVYGLYSADGSVRYDAMDVKPVDGTNIKISGPLGQYNSSNQFKNAKLIEIIEDSVEISTIKYALNQINSYMSFSYKYTHEIVKKEVPSIGESVVMAYTGGATGNLKADINNAETFGLNPEIFEVKAENCGNTTNVGINQSNDFRLYASKADGNGNELIISTLNDKVILSIEIEFSDQVDTFTVNGVAGNKETTLYNINSTSIIIKNTSTKDSSNQLRIKSITINFEVSNSAEPEYVDTHVFTDTEFRIKCGVDKALADIDGIESYGVRVTDSKGKFLDLEAEYEDNQYLYAIISLDDALTNKDRLDVTFTVQAYVVVDGITYVSDLTKEHSIRTMLEKYYNMSAYQDKVAPLYNLIQELN